MIDLKYDISLHKKVLLQKDHIYQTLNSVMNVVIIMTTTSQLTAKNEIALQKTKKIEALILKGKMLFAHTVETKNI